MGNAQSYKDLVNYWNLRAAGLMILFYDYAYAKRLDNMKNSFQEYIQNNLTNSFGENLIGIWSADNQNEIDFSVFQSPKIRCFMQHSGLSDEWSILNSSNMRIPYFYFNEINVLANMHKKNNGYYISCPLSERPFYKESFAHGESYIVNVDSDIYEFDYGSSETLSLPFIPELNSFYSSCSFSSRNSIRIEPNGIGFISNIYLDNLIFSPMHINELVEAIFKLANIEIKISDAGLTTRRIINHMGSINECKIFMDENVREILKQAPSKTITRSFFVEKLQKLIHPLCYVYKNGASLFNYMLEKQLFMTGLEFKCTKCELKFWVTLDNLCHFTKCEYCANNMNITTQLKDRDWKYRLSGIFKNAHGDKGSIPVILTLALLLRSNDFILDSCIFLPSMELTIKSEKICETDFIFCVIKGDKENKIEIAIGECKDAMDIQIGDIQNLKLVSSILRKSGIEVYIVFSKLSKNFTSSEIDLCKQLNDNIRQVIMVEKTELESFNAPYYGRCNTRGYSLDEMAIATEEIYFK